MKKICLTILLITLLGSLLIYETLSNISLILSVPLETIQSFLHVSSSRLVISRYYLHYILLSLFIPIA